MDDPRFPARRTDIAVRDVADLMIWPWFSLAKSPRHAPIVFEQGAVRIRVEPAGGLGIATLWDADALVWAVSQLTEALDAGRTPSRHLETPAYPLLRFLGRGVGRHDYALLRAAFDRLAATRVETTLRAGPEGAARFRWLEGWEPTAAGVRLTLPEWLFTAVCERRVLTLDSSYFDLTGGVARWLYRLVRKMGGRQHGGSAIGLRRLHARSGSPVRLAEFARHIRRIASTGLPGYQLSIERGGGEERLLFSRERTAANLSTASCGQPVNDDGTSHLSEIGRSPCRLAGERHPDSESSPCPASPIRPYNLYNLNNNRLLAADSTNPLPVDNHLQTGRARR
ncbi:replication initiator protein A [Azospirillum sp. BE72]|uniref:replication initiator protein A n=1 Tax=Azospirillum sp. BE72 TaxID=2817776 RepID=UPI00285D05A4|nr:replication initiator protein A [Azospirillum sp. BE72]MDR6773305.1 plasmid replication initiation protein [Azospirillum sp. BE72]